jgi:oxidoreductase, aldo/keto reductase family
MFIATKAGYEMWEGPYGNWGSRKHIISSLDQSLSRMKLDYVDLFYSHRYDPNTPIEETLNALVDVVKQGKALYIGISRWPLEQLKQAYNYLAERDVKVLTVQDRLNLLDRKPQNEGILSFCREVGVGFVSFSPLAQGLLTNKYLNGVPAHSRMEQNLFLQKKVLTPELLAYLKHLNSLASDRQESLAEMALAWVLAQKGVTSVIIGTSSVEQLAQNIKCVNAAPFVEEL